MADPNDDSNPKKMPQPEVTCYLCKSTFQKEVRGAAHNRNYFRCAECLKKLQSRLARRRF